VAIQESAYRTVRSVSGGRPAGVNGMVIRLRIVDDVDLYD
jgi:hypothetical protein